MPMSVNSDLFESYSMFANAFSFLGVPLTRDLSEADVAVLGVPYDLGTTGRAGCRHGPMGIAMLQLICVGRRNVGLGPLMPLSGSML